VTQAGTEESQAFAAHIRDISDRRRAARELEALAYEDPTTGFPNRAGLMRRIDPLSRFGAMVAIDLAGMGEIAATFGAGFANAVLRALALRLVNLLGEEGLLGRIGDKGIGLFLANGAHGGTGESHLERVRAMFAQPFAVDGRRLYLAARIGHAVLGDDNPEEALRNAELAMRLAKPGGEPVGYSAVLRDQRVRLLDREMALRAAASRPAQEFELHYQPLVCLDDGFLVGFEALLRWRHPKEGMIPPLDFIPLAEVTGLIVPIGSHVLQEAAAALARWSDFTARPLFVSVNLSPVQIAHGGIVETLGQTLHETGIDPTRLKLEITETAVMSNPAESLAVLGRMKSQGVTLALDDFGTGHSSLAMLRQLPVESLKIDRSFVQVMHDHDRDAALLGSILGLARALDLETIAEGIETEVDASRLRDFGCTLGQGWHFGRPMPEAEAMTILERR
jgi:EAL domain-containing protein (putative c-di-GMP-specific phosphodiesterase class I)/GGDEF domain-containing protein